ncbi:LysR family transcriptional regulator [Bradyrhizobium sp. PMVTL-01]|uniref:LysR family transcriptional regulator n=1 Tax=Bradyrhizobium sp. PMVTL-01 TaxID=3434999 RepID=UPI003F72D105
MLAPRRLIPSVSLLLAFEGVARTGTIAATAEELSLTQSAVSKQIQALEEQLGVPLFVREKKRLKLTYAGSEYAGEIRDALNRIAQASVSLKATPGAGTLKLAILPTFGMRWLAPRLGAFAALHPEVTVHLATRIQSFDFATDKFDAAIHFGEANWPGADHMKLMTETVVPVCSPDFRRERAVRDAHDLLRQPLLHLQSRPHAWENWFEVNGVSAPDLTGMVFDQFGAMAQAAIHGVGLALMPEFLIASEIREGRLVRATSVPIKSIGAYYLVWPKFKAQHPPTVKFRDWLSSLVGDPTASRATDAIPKFEDRK